MFAGDSHPDCRDIDDHAMLEKAENVAFFFYFSVYVLFHPPASFISISIYERVYID